MDFYSNLDSRLLHRQTPTLFEIISANELERLLSPSVRYILAHYASRHPRYLIRILNHFDDLNLFVRAFIEYKYLSSWNSTFIEKFYGLKRVNKKRLGVSATPDTEDVSQKIESLKRLSKIQLLGSLCDVLLVPYAKEKLDVLYEKYLPLFVLHRLKPRESFKDFIKYSFVRIYPIAVMLLRIVDLAFKLLFIGGKMSSTTILQYFFNIEFSRLNQYDYELDEKRVSKFLAAPAIPSNRVRPESMLESIAKLWTKILLPLKKTTLITSNSVLPISIFLLKFLEWWNTSEFSKDFGKDSEEKRILPKPDILPSAVLQNKKVGRILKTRDNLCRICHKEIHNPAIIETGYVFDYSCIYNYLREGDKESGGRCPVTGKILLGCKYSESLNEWKVTGIRRLMI
ncbi:hypothetical protein FOA43_003630 [Brettanomyces nanus]|uniref:Peroxisome assembly protein 12 n=1 Tax=Eeniella nana TaxID=13502 RepID=A0A875SBH5_EENNA|nr:uncharacterized protein FOA43_003630 [Brettanomyces nanus]QPG76244.1 hypothetical protein FOA43_003630 [Brettanomyces nanus]